MKQKKMNQLYHIGLMGVIENDTSISEQILLGIINYKVKNNWELYSLDKIDKFIFNHWNIASQKIDGIILFYDGAIFNKNPSLAQIPRVEICPDMINTNNNVSTITFDDYQTGWTAAEHLLFCGYKHFAFVGCSTKLWSRERKQGFIKCLQENGYNDFCCFETTWKKWFTASNIEQLKQWARELEYNTGVFVVNDHLASIFLQQCKIVHKNIPDQIGVMGSNNDIICCESFSPGLSTIAYDFQTLGSKAAHMLQNMIRQQKQEKISRLAMQKIILRDSTRINQDQHVAQAVKLMHNHYHEGITVNEICYQVPASRTVLFQKFKRITGETMHSKIIRIKLENAINLLKHSTLLIGEISLQCGFKNIQRFREAFKKLYQLSPGEYRKRYFR